MKGYKGFNKGLVCKGKEQVDGERIKADTFYKLSMEENL